MNKKIILRVILLILLCCTIIAVAMYGNKSLDITYADNKTTKLPEEFNAFTIVHLSDIHNTEFGKENRNLVEKVQNLKSKADIILITGDLIDSRRTNVNITVELVEKLVEIAPVYWVTGNHEFRKPKDFETLEKELLEIGVKGLRNSSDIIEIDGASIEIIGIDDYTFFAKDEIKRTFEADEEVVKTIESLNSENLYSILLSHRPNLLDLYSKAEVDVVFSGHTHGGQIKLPILGGLLAPDEGFLPYYDGDEEFYFEGNTQLFISRGLGNSIFPVRFLNRPEIKVVTLYSKK